MADISTGTVASFGTRLFVVGGASGIDTSPLLEAAYQQKAAEADRIDLKIEKNQAVISAYGTLCELGDTLLESLKLLKQTYGYSEQGDSVYDNMTAYLSTAADADPTSVIGVVVGETAIRGDYSIEVSQLAKKMKVTSNAVADKTAALGLDGSFTLTSDAGVASEITVTVDMSLEDINAAINAVSGDTNVSSTIVKTGDTSYTLAISGTETGESLTYVSTGGIDNIMQSLGVTDGADAFVNITQAAQNAIVYLDGLEIISSSNTIEDVLDDVDLSLYAELPGEIINLEIDYDYSSVKEAIIGFIDAYNEFRTFYDQHQSVSATGDVSDDAALFSDTMLNNMNFQISSVLSSVFGDDTDQVTNLGDMGIRFNSGNYLEISDEDMLNDILLNDYEELREMFQTSVVTDNTNIALISNDSTLTDFNLTFDITVDGGGDIVNVSVGGDTSLFDYDGSRIIGAEGTIYEGLTFVYVDDVNASITIDFRQGMADLLYNSVNAYANISSGLIQEAVGDLQSTNSSLGSEATRVRERAEEYYQREVERYARMEVEIAYAKTLLNTVRALLGIDNDDD
ncbi:MAG: flagellar filament capping protein FliD [Alphaproteobacteria bacterium]|nr:flagellar filament capping protein FliD [Alphaproteobacteria bacterium]